uniref:Transposase n=1 Tax=Steinernema glaseri TaxID=37863 RepID=A0A1I7YAX4_9BILA
MVFFHRSRPGITFRCRYHRLLCGSVRSNANPSREEVLGWKANQLEPTEGRLLEHREGVRQ